MLRIVTRSAAETEALGKRFGGQLRGGEIILLDGDLGAGKSALARGIAQGLGAGTWRGSPTFNLIHQYPTNPALYHIDLYRLGPGEIEDLGLEEYLQPDVVTVVEWAERASEYLRGLAREVTHVEMAHAGGEQRIIEIEGSAENVEAILSGSPEQSSGPRKGRSEAQSEW